MHSRSIPYRAWYDVIRRGREGDAHGGVLIAAKTDLSLNNLLNSKDFDFISGSISTAPRKKLIEPCLYRPPNRQDQEATDKAIQDTSDLRSNQKNNIFILEGDFNLPDIDWGNYTINGTQTSREVNNAYMQMTADLNLQRVVDIP